MADLDVALGLVRGVVRQLAPGSISGEQARAAVEVLAEVERVAQSGIARLSPRVVETGVFTKAGFASAPDWLGAATGTSAGVAKGRLAASTRAAAIPELAGALREGELSAPQLDLLVKSEVAAPGSVEGLLGLVQGEVSHQELSDEAARLKAAARSRQAEHLRRARVHAGRHVRWHCDPDRGIVGSFSCDEVAWARIAPELEAETERRWKAAGAGSGESRDALRLDALLHLLGTGGTDRAARPQVLVIVDAEALRRGTTSTGEICEIDGIGPISVEAARELLGEASVRFLVKEGEDIRTVTSSTRDLAIKTALALVVRDRCCVRPGCGKVLGLQDDHCFVDFSQDGPTAYENLARLCAGCHHLKTNGGWKLEGGPGHWKWIAPEHPPSAGRLSRQRRLAAAKAAGGIFKKAQAAKSKRNQPQQT